MTDPEIVKQLQADAIFFGTRQEPLLVDDAVCREMAECWEIAANEIERLRKERDEARQRTNSILTEIDCRIEHGAESNGHLEAIRSLFKET